MAVCLGLEGSRDPSEGTRDHSRGGGRGTLKLNWRERVTSEQTAYNNTRHKARLWERQRKGIGLERRKNCRKNKRCREVVGFRINTILKKRTWRRESLG